MQRLIVEMNGTIPVGSLVDNGDGVEHRVHTLSIVRTYTPSRAPATVTLELRARVEERQISETGTPAPAAPVDVDAAELYRQACALVARHGWTREEAGSAWLVKGDRDDARFGDAFMASLEAEGIDVRQEPGA